MSETPQDTRPEPFRDDLLDGQHVLVTGGGSGLGASMAARFAQLGARVTVVGRRRGRLDETVAAIEAAGGRAAGVPMDLRDPESVEAGVTAAEEQQGPVHALVNNAAGNFLAFTEDISARGFDAIVGTNLYGTFHATTACGRRWMERGEGGRVLSIVTTYAMSGSAYLVPSAVSKAGVVSLTRSLAVEWGRHGIRLNAIAPGPIPTKGAWSRLVPSGLAGDDGAEGGDEGSMEARLRGRVPLGRFGTRDELGDLAVFLISNLSAYVTGEVMTMDGGEHLATGGWFNEMTRQPRETLESWFASLRPRPAKDRSTD